MWAWFLVIFGLVAGFGVGYKYNHKKVVPIVKFVSKIDREKVLEEHSVYIDKSSKCSVCGDAITIENLGAIMKSKSEITFVCPKPQCMTLSDLLRARPTIIPHIRK